MGVGLKLFYCHEIEYNIFYKGTMLIKILSDATCKESWWNLRKRIINIHNRKAMKWWTKRPCKSETAILNSSNDKSNRTYIAVKILKLAIALNTYEGVNITTTPKAASILKKCRLNESSSTFK